MMATSMPGLEAVQQRLIMRKLAAQHRQGGATTLPRMPVADPRFNGGFQGPPEMSGGIHNVGDNPWTHGGIPTKRKPMGLMGLMKYSPDQVAEHPQQFYNQVLAAKRAAGGFDGLNQDQINLINFLVQHGRQTMRNRPMPHPDPMGGHSIQGMY